MNDHSQPDTSRIDQVCDAFEQAWKDGRRPQIEEGLSEVEPAQRPGLLVELLKLDVHYRQQNGEDPAHSDYVSRFPGQSDLLDAVFEDEDRPDTHDVSRGEIVSTVLYDSKRDPAAEPETMPDRIGRYRIDELLGEGGFGRVFRGFDEDLKRAVAIKVPRKDRVSRPEDVEAYLSEAQTVAKLKHPRIVPVFDVGHTEDGLCFVVSDFLTGGDLAKRIKRSRPDFCEASDWMCQLAEALHIAHRQGVVHRDIKPANILLDEEGQPHLADFGLALREEDFGRGAGLAGTPAYMSPEQARGEGHRVDGRSDIFSLGIVFYELLTGRRPFRGTLDEVLDQIKHVEAKPPRQVDDKIPQELERICLKTLAKRAVERYSTAKDLAEDLLHWLHPLKAQPAPAARWELPSRKDLEKLAFISYASQDKEMAYPLCQFLEAQGVGCWIAPRDVSPGSNYAEEIVKAIDATPITLLLLSSHANQSVHVANEIERATSKRKRVIPIRLEEVLPSPGIELHLAATQWVDAWHLTADQLATQLAENFRGVLGTPQGMASPPRLLATSQRQVKIIPKGLRSFDANDADFFLELLPGPRDRDGLPENLRFWKQRIETTSEDQTFSVGLIYGPSGCGKSSLVKAGLLPRLAEQVVAIYIEATPDETETRLQNALAQRLNTKGRLGDMLADLRRGAGCGPGRKSCWSWISLSNGCMPTGKKRARNWWKPCGNATASICNAWSWCGMIFG